MNKEYIKYTTKNNRMDFNTKCTVITASAAVCALYGFFKPRYYDRYNSFVSESDRRLNNAVSYGFFGFVGTAFAVVTISTLKLMPN
ncbi:MAG: hypothetical protein Terrestrivirus6_56 [Terrestrivirus sp.]|uniref:Uncharacterized protein n=1 Tax=Terrestrivirus sp. TaxID=2487775 RepID=A0A3G4ZNF7_9VIRU|nr:MAG: hypothetical protein Terrestrivirus6_56 [Terrestrivirus sp.]